ncbi:MAG: hypothetical protein ACOX8C_01925 [Saccharomonospora viridis]|uniref:hypothetical protein n=1 Tax=Saccharomonospora viridis TaxID=1852 RepID=UPI003D93DC28
MGETVFGLGRQVLVGEVLAGEVFVGEAGTGVVGVGTVEVGTVEVGVGRAGVGAVFRRGVIQANQRDRSLCAGLRGGLCAPVARWRALRRFDVRGRKANNSVI